MFEAFGVAKQKLFGFYENKNLLEDGYPEALRTYLENDVSEIEIEYNEEPRSKFVSKYVTDKLLTHIENLNGEKYITSLELNSGRFDTTFQLSNVSSANKYTITPSLLASFPSGSNSNSNNSSN